ncbi:SLIP GTPase, partial [Anseranas semipalmata]|nr:SLIP GTPase [Anseranas semipalmata]
AERDDTDEMARRQPRMQQAFHQEEQEILRNYMRTEDRVRKILSASCEKISHLFFLKDMPGHLAYLRDRITTLNSKPAFDPIRIGLFGSSGAGKSTLLNTILGKRFFLPVSGTRTCTSCQVQVSTCTSTQYEAKIFLLSEQEWKDEVRSLLTLLESENGDSENDSDIDHAIKVLQAIYGKGAENKNFEDLMRTKPEITIPSSRVITLRQPEAQDLSHELDPYIRNQESSEGFGVVDAAFRSEQMRLWPLIKHVQVTLPPSDFVPEGVIFVDIPGIGDSNKKRDDMWKEVVLECTSIWIIADVERVFGARAHETMVQEAIKACQIGKCNNITFVVTKIDKLNLDEYLRHDAILEMIQDLKTQKTRAIRDNMQKRLPSDMEVLQHPELVFTVSAQEYWNSTVLTEEETEISRLRDHIRKLYLHMKRNQLQEYMQQILVVFSLVDVYHSAQPSPGPPMHQDRLNEFLSVQIQDLKKAAESAFGHIDLPLLKGVKTARSTYKRNMEKIFMLGTNSRGFHRTLKAVCMRKGVYVSRIFHRIDINNCLAKPIYAEIDMTFANIFRKQRLTRASLQAAINEFSTEVKTKFTEIGKNTNMNESKLNFLIQETDIIVRALEKEILLKKKAIYESLELFIQAVLSPYYEEAANIRGKASYERMKETLMQNIGLEVQKAMFELARERMLSQFQDLMEQITTKLSKDLLNMLNVIFCQHDQLVGVLPVLREECQEIQNLMRNMWQLD